MDEADAHRLMLAGNLLRISICWESIIDAEKLSETRNRTEKKRRQEDGQRGMHDSATRAQQIRGRPKF